MQTNCVRRALVAAMTLGMIVGTAMFAQTNALQPVRQADRVPAGADLGPQVQLAGHVPWWATAANQTAVSVDLSAPMRVWIVLAREPAVQAAFETLLADQQTPGSPLFHEWLSPEQIGADFGPTAPDVAAIVDWLTAQGLAVEVSPSRAMLSVSGSTAQVAGAFRTTFASFLVHGEGHLSAVSEPFVPAALAPVIRSVYGLVDTPIEPGSHVGLGHLGTASASHPEYTYTVTSGTYHYLTPNDFAVIYDIKSVYGGGNTGAKVGTKAQRVAIIGRSRVAPTDISEYEANTGLPAVVANVVIPPGGVDPGLTQSGDQAEATLDVDRVVGTAPGVTPDLIVATNGSGGIGLAAAYNVNTLVDPVMTISFTSCESSGAQSSESYWDSLFSQAAGEGISVFVGSGDSGVAGCEPGNATPTIFPQTAAINLICASTYATCLGGTEFNDTANPAAYWSGTNASGLQSALSYIPEGAWNEPSTTTAGVTTYDDEATGGGASRFIAKPSWQTGVGVPADGARDTPDIAFSSAGHDGYYTCLDYQFPPDTCLNGSFVYFSGTSASAPGMAGIAALLNTAAGKVQGNLNPLLYRLAASSSIAFHDATIASSGVSSCSTATPSMCNNSVPSATGLTGGLAGFALTAGYDEATGLGSLDVANFIPAYLSLATAGFSLTPATTTLSFVSGASAGNTDVITVASMATFSGTVVLTCSISASTAVNQPTCTVTPGSVTPAAGSSLPATLTISSTTAHSMATPPRFGPMVGVVFAMLFCLLPWRRRRVFTGLTAMCLLSLAAIQGCSSANSAAAGSHPLSSSAGTYTVTVTGTNGAASTVVNTAISLTIE